MKTWIIVLLGTGSLAFAIACERTERTERTIIEQPRPNIIIKEPPPPDVQFRINTPEGGVEIEKR